MRRILFVLMALIALISLVACGASAPAAPAAATAAPAAVEEPAAEATEAPAEEEAAAEEPAAEEPTPTPDPSIPLVAAAEEVEGKANVRWFVGLGTGTDAPQIAAQQQVVADFNASHPDINLILEIVTFNGARDALLTQIAAGQAPDIVGPVGHGGSNLLKGQFLDLAPLAEAADYDFSVFDPALVDFYQTDEGLVGLPFAVFPGATYFQRGHFDEAGLNYPPFEYGEPYVWPDGTEEEWNYDTLTKVAKILTVDINGNAPVNYDDSGNVEHNPDFDPTQITQYGFVPQFQSAWSVGTYYGGAAQDYNPEDNSAAVPESWQEAWKWWYEGMWGDEIFQPNAPVWAGPEFGAGNPFASGNVSMAITQQWYTCCLGTAGDSWDMAILPSGNESGVTHGRLDADTFRVLEYTDEPEATFEVLDYLTGEGSLPLLQVYGGLPARTADQDAFYALKAEEYPFVENWETIRAGLSYPDIPSAEGYRPNYPEVEAAYNTFTNLVQTNPDLDIDAEIANFIATLTEIMQRPTE